MKTMTLRAPSGYLAGHTYSIHVVEDNTIEVIRVLSVVSSYDYGHDIVTYEVMETHQLATRSPEGGE